MSGRNFNDVIGSALTSLSFILLVAFGARLIFATNQVSKIPPDVLSAASFDQETGSIAAAVATHKGFSNPFNRQTGPTAWLTPVYPLVVAGTFKLLGVRSLRAFYFLVLLNILFSSAVCVPVYLVGRRVADRTAATAAAWLWALFPAAIMVPFEWIWDTSLATFLAALILWMTVEVSESADVRDWCGYGLLGGLTLMTNPSVGILLPFLIGWTVYRARARMQPMRTGALRRAMLALGIASLCCVPWTIRNYAVFHRLVPLRSNFSFELYIGNNENYADDHPRFPPPITKERETVRYIHMGETAFMDEELRKAKLFILSHPRKVLALFGDRFAAFWTGAPFAVDTFLKTNSWLVRSLLLCATLSGIGALAGILVLLGRRSPFTFPLAAYPIIFPLVYCVTHTSLRYRQPVDPMVLLLTAIAGVAAYRFFVQPLRGRVEINSG
jgi:4-amino-4-deoxy-L-arabinose transferase-like glycosyltransferase